MISTRLLRTSALLLAMTGVILLFAADEILPWLAPGTPASAGWLGQVLGAALLALAWLDSLHQKSLLGGIYGRPILLPNVTFHLIASLSVLRAAIRPSASSTALWVLGGALGLLAIAYGWLMLRGPLERDLVRYRADSGAA